MPVERDGFVRSMKLVTFLSKYFELIDAQIESVRSDMDSFTDQIMSAVNEISQITSDKKSDAEKMLDDTYMNPDEDTKELMNSIQGSVDDLLEQLDAGATAESIEQSGTSDTKVRRFGGVFSKHMEALSTMDSAVGDIMMKIMGGLSANDVVAQRLEHVSRAANALMIGLTYVLVDFKGRFNPTEIEKIKNDLLDYTYRQYTMEEERKAFAEVFTVPTQVENNRFG